MFLHQQILLFIFWKGKTCQLQLGFGQKQNYKLLLCYFWFELMKNTIPKKIPLLFSRPKKIPFGQNVRPKKNLQTPPSLKYVSGAPGGSYIYFFCNNIMIGLCHRQLNNKLIASGYGESFFPDKDRGRTLDVPRAINNWNPKQKTGG